MERITLDEFMQQAPETLEAFAAATRQAQAEGAEGFAERRFQHRTKSDWLREAAAYEEYVEVQERIAQDRRSGVERRRVR